MSKTWAYIHVTFVAILAPTEVASLNKEAAIRGCLVYLAKLEIIRKYVPPCVAPEKAEPASDVTELIILPTRIWS